MELDILPIDMRVVTIRKNKKKNSCTQITLPPDLVRRHGLEDKEEILIAYLGRGTDDPTKKKINY